VKCTVLGEGGVVKCTARGGGVWWNVVWGGGGGGGRIRAIFCHLGAAYASSVFVIFYSVNFKKNGREKLISVILFHRVTVITSELSSGKKERRA